MRTCYDAITPANIPATAAMVAGYVDGRYAWHQADWARFPRAVKVTIAVFSSTNAGTVLDVEAGCSSPANAPGWVVRRRGVGVDPTVYCSLAAWPTVRAAFAAAHVPEPHWWIAAYPGNGPKLYPGAVAHQYANPGPVDISVVADYWPGVDPALMAAQPAQTNPPAHTTPPEEDDMRPWFFACKDGRACIVRADGPHALTPANWGTWRNLGKTTEPGMAAMDVGPFEGCIDDLGGLK